MRAKFITEGDIMTETRRVVEAEIKLPKLEEIKLPKVDLEPVRSIAEDILITSIGVGVLVAQGLGAAVKAANAAGRRAAEHPGPVTRALLSLVGKPEASHSTGSQIRMQVPVLPIDDYQELSANEIIARLPQLTPQQLRVVREYEAEHQARAAVTEAIDRQLAAN